MSWRFYNALQSLPSLSADWDRINRAGENHILLDSRFIGPLVRYFASPKTLLAVREVDQPAVALVERTRPGFWQTFQPGQAPLGAILLGGNGYDPAEPMRELMHDLPGCALGFSVTRQDPDFTCFANLNGSLPAETLDYIQTPRLTISGNYEDYWKQRSKNLVHNLSRQRRRLREQGSVLELLTEECPATFGDAVREYGLLETTGWKGEEGSAVAAENTQGCFYRDMMENFGSLHEAVIYRLLLNGKTVASDLCLQRNGTLIILKTAYDESIQGLSLGLLLHQEIFMKAFSDRVVNTIEFYGQVRDWHTKWTTEIRRMYHINFYRYSILQKIRTIAKCLDSSEMKSA